MNTFQTLFLVGFTLLVLPKIPWRQMRCLFLAWRGGDRAEEEDFAGWKPNPARRPLLARIYVGLLLGWSAHWFALSATTLHFRNLPHAEMQARFVSLSERLSCVASVLVGCRLVLYLVVEDVLDGGSFDGLISIGVGNPPADRRCILRRIWKRHDTAGQSNDHRETK